MSHAIATLLNAHKGKKLSRAEVLALRPDLTFKDGRTKQCYADECNIEKIMARYAVTGTISHIEKTQGQYGDFSDFDFTEQTRKLTQGREIFDGLPAEVRREFNQNPQAFFNHVNDPENRKKPDFGIPALAMPGNQLLNVTTNDADKAAAAAAREPATENPKNSPTKEAAPSTTPSGDT